MNQLKITTDNNGRLTTASRDQIRSLIKSTGGIFGERLAAVALPKIEREFQWHVAAQRPAIRFARLADFSAKTTGATVLCRATDFSAPAGMTMVPVKSSSLRRVGYSQANRTLKIEFKAGSVCDYLQVPPSEYAGLMNASSHGKYFHIHIKGRYSYRKIVG